MPTGTVGRMDNAFIKISENQVIVKYNFLPTLKLYCYTIEVHGDSWQSVRLENVQVVAGS